MKKILRLFLILLVVVGIGDNLGLDYTAQGDTINLAARLQTLARPGSVLVSEKVRLAAGDRFLFEDAGLFDIKGKKRPVRLFVLVRKLAEDPSDADRDAGSWPFSEQIRFHRDAGRAMETLYRDNLSPHFAAMAYHFYKAEDWPKAFVYSLEAGNQARKSYACQEALNCFDWAIEILSNAELVDKQEISLQLFKWKGGMHYCLGQMQAGHKAFETMYAEAQRLEDREAEAEALFRIGWISFYMHEPWHAIASLSKAIELSETEGLNDILLKSLSSLGFVYSILGRIEEARPLFIRALDLSSDLKDAESRAWGCSPRSFTITTGSASSRRR